MSENYPRCCARCGKLANIARYDWCDDCKPILGLHTALKDIACFADRQCAQNTDEAALWAQAAAMARAAIAKAETTNA